MGIRLALLSQDELTEIETENESTPFIPVDMLAAAWKLHAMKTPDRNNGNLRLRRGTVNRDHHQFIAIAANKTASDSDDEKLDSKSEDSKSESKDSSSDSNQPI